jgi:hypothetical protein
METTGTAPKSLLDRFISKVSRILIGKLSRVKLNKSSSTLDILVFILARLLIGLLGCGDVLTKVRLVSQFRQFKQSDTLVILGCGNSLNELTESQWSHIKNCDIAGLSYSCILDLKQNYHFIERPYRFGLENRLFLKDKLFARYDEGKIKNIIWKALDHHEQRPLDLSIVPEFVTPLEANIYLKNLADSQLEVQEKIIKLVLSLGLHKHIFFRINGTIFSLALLGIALNYKNIVFAGIDLNGSDYFFYDEDKFPECAELTSLHRYQREIKYGSETNFHATVDPSKGIPVDDLLKILVKHAGDVNFYTASNKSKLADFLDVYDFSCESRFEEVARSA